MDQQQYDTFTEILGGIKKDVTVIRTEQIEQGKSLVRVCTKVTAHSWIHRISGVAILSLVAAWFRSNFFK